MCRVLRVAVATSQEEVRMPLQSGEGPICLIMGPSRELVRQIHEVVQACANTLTNDTSTQYPEIRVALVTGEMVKKPGISLLDDNLSLTSVMRRPSKC